MSEAWEAGQIFDITRSDLKAAEANVLQNMKSDHLTGHVKIRNKDWKTYQNHDEPVN